MRTLFGRLFAVFFALFLSPTFAANVYQEMPALERWQLSGEEDSTAAGVCVKASLKGFGANYVSSKTQGTNLIYIQKCLATSKTQKDVLMGYATATYYCPTDTPPFSMTTGYPKICIRGLEQCPAGTTLDVLTNYCESKKCSPSEKLEGGQCVPAYCPLGQVANPTTAQCEAKQCPTGEELNGAGICVPKPPVCKADEVLINGICWPKDEPQKCKADETASFSGGKLVCTPKKPDEPTDPDTPEEEKPQGSCPNGYHESTQNGRKVCVQNAAPKPGEGGTASEPGSGTGGTGTGGTGSGGDGEGGCKGTKADPCHVKVDETGTPVDGGEGVGTEGLGEAMNSQQGGLEKIGRDKPDTSWSFNPGWLQAGSCSPYSAGSIKGVAISIDYCWAADIGRAVMAFMWGVLGVFLCARMVFKTVTGS